MVNATYLNILVFLAIVCLLPIAIFMLFLLIELIVNLIITFIDSFKKDEN